jgi:phosphoenolpyruvate carboxykinase (ATP)
MLYDKIKKHNVNVWLVNTGYFIFNFRWINGKYGVGKRISFLDSLRMVDAINEGKLDNISTYTSKIFNFHVPTSVPGMDSTLLHPENTWHSKIEYE